MTKEVQLITSLWPRSEPFTYGIFPVHPHPRLALHNIKKLVCYAKSKGKSGFPNLSYSVWKHVACNKLQLSEDLAWILFYTGLTMITHRSESMKELEHQLHMNPNASDIDRVKNTQAVDLFTFALFLYIQQINKISLRASAVSSSAEWPPNLARPAEVDNGRSTPIRPCRNLDEQYQLQFVSENLAEILDILVGSDGSTHSNPDMSISEEAVEALNLIMEGTADQSRSIYGLSELLKLPSIQPSTGFVKVTRAYGAKSLHSWIRSWLVSNPFSVENCIRNGRRLQWRSPLQPNAGGTLPQSMSASQSDNLKRLKIATNSHQIPKNGGRNGNKLVIMSMLSRQIIARSSATLDGATLKIHRAHCSYLYLLSPMRSVTLDKCRKLTIVLGPIESTLQLNQCEDCLIIAACRRVVLVSCRRCTLHLSTASRPILVQPSPHTAVSSGSASPAALGSATLSQGINHLGASNSTTCGTMLLGNEEILLAPFHTTYLRLADHLHRVNLNAEVNYWNQPFLLGHDSCRNDQNAHQSLPGRGRCWDLMRPAHFYPFNIPLLTPVKSDNSDSKPQDETIRWSTAALDLSATLITDSSLSAGGVLSHQFEDFADMVNKKCLQIPIPTEYLEAIHQRASIYHTWPQHIADAQLTMDQRQLFGTLVDHRFRQWLTESGNLRQLQLLELSTGHAHGQTQVDVNGNAAGVPPLTNQRNSEDVRASNRPAVGGRKTKGDRIRSTGMLSDNKVTNKVSLY